MIKIQYIDLDIVYVSNYYDHPLSGLCMYENELCKFDWQYSEDEVIIIKMSYKEKLKALLSKKMFELCVGYHQTYVNNKKSSWFYYRNPKWFFKLLYKFYYRSSYGLKWYNFWRKKNA